MKSLKQVTDRFSLFNHGRKIGANKRRYIVKAVQDMLNNDETQESLRLGEAYGFYGHGARERAKKLSLRETEVITIDGKPVVVENVPSNRTVSVTCNDDGIVEHTEEFLDTPTGKIALSMWESKAGGWSWATGGRDSANAAIATSFHGFDYVLKPNYLSLEHPAMMMESSGQEDMLLESLRNVGGFDDESASNIIRSMSSAAMYDHELLIEQEQERMYLESVNADLKSKVEAQEQFRSMMLESLSRLPFYMTDEQKAALMRLDSEHDKKVVDAMFESFGAKPLDTLPTGAHRPSSVSVQKEAGMIKNEVSFDTRRRFS